MPDAFYRAQAIFSSDTGVPRDACQNTWHFRTTGVVDHTDAITGMNTLLVAFYQAIDNTIFSENLATTANLVYYNLEDPEPRQPIEPPAPFTIVPLGTSYPNELAICLSFQAAPTSGIPQARKRGRVFLGPLGLVGTDDTGDVRVPSGTRTAITAAAATMMAGMTVDATVIVPSVFSRAEFSFHQSLDASFFAITDGWVDNAFDVQRRRGSDATLRSSFTV